MLHTMNSRSTGHILYSALLALLIAVLLPIVAHAQQSSGTIVGNVYDQTGAVVPGAKILVTNTDTNTVRTSLSDASGAYSIPALPAGNYRLNVSLAGFASQQTDKIILLATATARIDFNLKPGSVEQTVNVEASNAAVLQTETPTMGTTVDAKKMEDLPLNGRNFVQLTQLIPGVNPGTVGSITDRRGRGSIGQSDSSFGATSAQANGQRDTQNRYFIDNVEVMDYDAYTFSFSPSVDAISQFKVDTTGSGAEAGGATGAYVNLVLKSGTNKYHGTLWEFNRNNYFTSTHDFIAQKDITATRLNRNQFGGNVGGPVRIPHLYNGKDKTFFFFNAEGGYNLSTAAQTAELLPPNATRTGDFSNLVYASGTAKGQPAVVYDPTTGLPFTGNQIPQARWSTPIQTFLKYVPAATSTSQTSNYLTPLFPVLSHQFDYIIRIDHAMNQKNAVHGHYIHDETYLAGAPLFGGDQDNNMAKTLNIGVTYTHVFSDALVNDFTYGRDNFNEHEFFGYTNDKSYDVANLMGIPLASGDPRFYGIPTMTISGSDGVYVTPHTPRVGPRDRSNTIDQGIDTLSWQRGHHFLKAGFEIARRNDTFDQIRGPQGSFTFTGQYTTGYDSNGKAIAGTGSALADFLLGYVQSDSINPTHTFTNISQFTQGYYIQDNWSLRQNLTLNLGVRWDHWGQWTQDNDKMANFTLAANGLNIDSVYTPSNSGFGRGLINTHKLDFQPRVGFNWQPLGTAAGIVLRGAYGIYFVPELPNTFYQLVEGAQAQSGAGLTGNAQIPNLTMSNPFPGVTIGTSTTYPFLPAIDPHLKEQYAQEWNLTFEQSLPGKILFDIGYAGAKGTHNYVWYSDLNQPTPVDPATLPSNYSVNSRRPNQNFLRAVQGDFSRGSSNYHSLQTKLDRRVGHGLTALASYTWSKAISGPGDAGGFVGNGTLGANTLNLYDIKSDRSLAAFDLPHRFAGTVLYDVPFFNHTRGVVKLLADGFQLSTIVIAQSGPAAGLSDSALVTATGLNSRPDVVPGASLYSGRTYKQWFNPSAFQKAAAGTFGNSRRAGAVRLPGVLNQDFSAVKGFKLGDQRNFQIRADIFNLWMRYNPDPGKVSLARNASTFGMLGSGASDTTSRIVQVSGKFYF